MTPEQFEKELKGGKISPVYFFYGEEDFLIEEAVDALIRKALRDAPREFNLDVFYGDEVETREIIARANSYPMMAERRVVVWKGLERLRVRKKPKDEEAENEEETEGNKGGQKALLYSYLEEPMDTTVLVLISRKDDEFLRQRAISVRFSRLRASSLWQWVLERAEFHKKRMTPDACEIFLTYVEPSLHTIDRELEKIALYVGEKETIDAEDVKSAIGVSKVYNVFELAKAIGDRDLKKSIEICERMTEIGVRPERMVATIAQHFMKLLKLDGARKKKMSEQEISKLFKYPSYVREYQAQLRHFKTAELERSFSYLAGADEKLKYTSEDPRSVMTVLLHELLR